MVDVFEQVEEELRSDRYKRLARTWLPVAGGVLLVALIAALAFWGWDSWQTSRADKASLAYDRGLEALQANNPVTADAAFKQAAEEGNGAYKAMALMHRSGIALEAGRDAEALTLMDEAAKASRNPLIADLAAYKAALLAMDTASLEDVQRRLEPLAREGRPLAAYAQEAQALVLVQNGQGAQAKDILIVLKNGLETPEDIKQRAELVLASIDGGSVANIQAIVAAMRNLPPEPAPTAAPSAAAPPAQPAAPARP